MAFDGIVVADLVHELREELLNGRIAKIVQPEAEGTFLSKKSSGRTEAPPHLCGRISPAGISDRHKQTRAHDRA